MVWIKGWSSQISVLLEKYYYTCSLLSTSFLVSFSEPVGQFVVNLHDTGHCMMAQFFLPDIWKIWLPCKK